MHNLTMDQKWDIFGKLFGSGSSWFFFGMAQATGEDILKYCALIAAIVASIFTAASCWYTIKRNKVEIDIGKRKLIVDTNKVIVSDHKEEADSP